MTDQPSEIQWIDQIPDIERPQGGLFGPFLRELQARPNTWAVFKVLPEGGKWTSTVTYRNYWGEQLEFAQRTIDGVTTVYVQWATTDLFALGLNTRITNCLRRIGCQTIDDLCKFSRNDLSYLNNMGERSVSLLESKLAEVGRKLATEDHTWQEMHQYQWGRYRKESADE